MLVLRITSPLFKRKASGVNITVNQGLIIVTSNQNKNIAWSHVNIEIVLRPIGGEPSPNFENRRDLIFVSFIIFFALIFLLSYVCFSYVSSTWNFKFQFAKDFTRGTKINGR